MIQSCKPGWIGGAVGRMHVIRWLGGTTEQAILTEAGTGRPAVEPGLPGKQTDSHICNCLLGRSTVESGFKARAKPGKGLARPSPWLFSWGAGLWRQP